MRIIASLFALSLLACAGTEPAPDAEPLADFRHPSENLWTGGQPTDTDIAAAKDLGITRVINLRTDGESDQFDFEEAAAKEHGLTYVRIPVDGQMDVTIEKAEALAEQLATGEKTLVHCGTGNRVGALVAIDAWTKGATIDDAVTKGKAHGLTKLEDSVRAYLLAREPGDPEEDDAPKETVNVFGPGGLGVDDAAKKEAEEPAAEE